MCDDCKTIRNSKQEHIQSTKLIHLAAAATAAAISRNRNNIVKYRRKHEIYVLTSMAIESYLFEMKIIFTKIKESMWWIHLTLNTLVLAIYVVQKSSPCVSYCKSFIFAYYYLYCNMQKEKKKIVKENEKKVKSFVPIAVTVSWCTAWY